jgi:YegS/Rv2252/BmrU family lipid kinase
MMGVQNKIIFIINPIAGVKGKRRLEKKIDAFFSGKNFELVKFYTAYPSHAMELARQAVNEKPFLLVAAGGDGTINEIACALINTGIPLGVIPLGSGNGFARHFNLPFNIKKALKLLLTGAKLSVDVGYMNGRPFFCTAGIGFDAEIGYYYREYNHRGFIAYALSFAKVFSWYKSKEYILEIDGDRFTFKAFFITIANISQFGYNFFVAPHASTLDGAFDVVVVKRFPKWKGWLIAFRSFFGTIDTSQYVWHKLAQNVKIISPVGEKFIHIDGEAGILSGELDYQIKNAELKVIVNDKKQIVPFPFKKLIYKSKH